jgi:hypothetical protein
MVFNAKTLKRIAAGVLIALALLGAYLCLWPVPAQPVSWNAPQPPGFTGPFAANQRLASLQSIPLTAEHGPEHIVLGRDGTAQQVFANTGGRVLGFAFLANGQMVATDAMRGLLAIAPDGAIQVLSQGVSAQDPVRYANSVVVGPDQTVYFTDSSTRFSPSKWGGTYEASVLDILE